MAMALLEDCDSAACLTHVLARSLDDKCFQAMVDGDIDGHMPGRAGARDGAPVRASDRGARHTTADFARIRAPIDPLPSLIASSGRRQKVIPRVITNSGKFTKNG